MRLWPILLLALATPALAQSPSQGPPDFGIDTSGTMRKLSVRDATLGSRVPLSVLDTTTHSFTAPVVLVDLYGAIPNDALDDKVAIQAAVTAATASGHCVSGSGRTYLVNGSIVLPNNACLQDIKLVETGTGVQRPITSACGASPTYLGCEGPFTLRRVRVDRGPSDSNTDAAGIWLTHAVNGILMEDVEVTGGAAGYGMQLAYSQNIKLVRPWIHDMEWANTTGIDPSTEQMTGLACGQCGNLEIIQPRVANLWGTIPWVASADLVPSQGLPWRTYGGRAYRATSEGVAGTTPPTCTSGTCSDGLITWTYMGPVATTKRAYQTDGFGFSVVNGATIIGGLFEKTGEGVDIGASNNVWLYGVTFKDIDSWGEKWCHTDTNSGSIGTRAIRPGIAGVVTCGADPGPTYISNHRIIDAVVTDPGASGNWLGTHAGFWSGEVDNVQFINTSVVDTQAVPTMTQGYRSDATTTALGATVLNPYAAGWSLAAMTGVWKAVSQGAAGGGFSLTGNVATTGNLSVTGDISGSGFFSLTRDALTLVNGLNSNIPVARSAYTVAGITGPVSLGGFVAQPDGTFLRIASAFVQPMTIVNEDTSSTAVNRIRTNTGADVVLPTSTSYAEFMYSNQANRWILLSMSPLPTITTAQHRIVIDAAGTQSVPFGVGNGGGTPNTEVAIDLSPTNNAPGIRSAQVASISAGGTGDANLVFRTSQGATPVTRMTIASNGGATIPLAAPGIMSIPLALANAGGTANTQVAIDLSPTSNAPAVRSAQIASVSSDGTTDANLVFRTSQGNVPADRVTISSLGLVTLTAGLKFTPVAVSNLGTCNAGAEGTMRAVNDANSTTYNATAAGGGANRMPVYCNGTNWVLH